MPPQNRVRCDDGRDLTQDLPSQPMPPNRQPASIVVSELEPLSTQLPSKDAILFHQIREGLPLLAIHPAGQDGEHHLDSRRVNHGGSLYHEARSAAPVRSTELWDPTGRNRYRKLSTSIKSASGSLRAT